MRPDLSLGLQSGKLYLSTSFLTFTSLDRRSCRLTLPLATVRRVEKLAPGQDGTVAGAFALSLTLFHGLRIVRMSLLVCYRGAAADLEYPAGCTTEFAAPHQRRVLCEPQDAAQGFAAHDEVT